MVMDINLRLVKDVRRGLTAFTSLVKIVLQLPDVLINEDESAVSNAEQPFNDIEDGQIMNDIASLPSKVVSDITGLWATVTADIVQGWAGACASTTALTTTPVTALATPSQSGYSSAYINLTSAISYTWAALTSTIVAASQAASKEEQATNTTYQSAATVVSSLASSATSSGPTMTFESMSRVIEASQYYYSVLSALFISTVLALLT
ncbi:hypothetical protein M433DRAFT_132140 [Acidomyces richmondensis BFW]|nr:hypothetical protein M433DRAFT_132140 [Acidomyces richmondensis BFW]